MADENHKPGADGPAEHDEPTQKPFSGAGGPVPPQRNPALIPLLALIALGALGAIVYHFTANRTTGPTSGSHALPPDKVAALKDARAAAQSTQLKKVTISYGNSTCEAPTIVAYEKGFWREEGLEVNLVLSNDFAAVQQGLTLGNIDATQAMAMSLVKPLEGGLDVAVVGGLHTGCIKILAPVDSPLNKPEDLKGKRIGVPGIGDSAYTFATRVLATKGFDPAKDFTWRVFPSAELELAMAKNEVDAIVVGEPIGIVLTQRKVAKTLLSMAGDPPYDKEYCCLAVIAGKLAKEDPETAAKITRGYLKGAKWTAANPVAAAKIEVDGQYVATTFEYNAAAIQELNFLPSTTGAREALFNAARDLKLLNIVQQATDERALADSAFKAIPGIDDAWINNLTVEQEPAPAVSAQPLSQAALAANGAASQHH